MAIDLVMTLKISPSSYDTMAQGDNAGYSIYFDPNSNTTVKHYHGPRLHPMPWASVCCLVTSWATQINVDHVSGKTTDTDTAAGT